MVLGLCWIHPAGEKVPREYSKLKVGAHQPRIRLGGYREPLVTHCESRDTPAAANPDKGRRPRSTYQRPGCMVKPLDM